MRKKKMKNNFKYAGFWRRVGASVIDLVLLTLIQMGIFMSFGLSPNVFDTAQTNAASYGVAQLVFFIVNIAFDVIFWVNFDGATPGKKALGIRIVQENGKPLTYSVALVRWFCYFISLIPFGLGFFWAAFDKKKQAWHDKLVSTIVVRV